MAPNTEVEIEVIETPKGPVPTVSALKKVVDAFNRELAEINEKLEKLNSSVNYLKEYFESVNTKFENLFNNLGVLQKNFEILSELVTNSVTQIEQIFSSKDAKAITRLVSDQNITLDQIQLAIKNMGNAMYQTKELIISLGQLMTEAFNTLAKIISQSSNDIKEKWNLIEVSFHNLSNILADNYSLLKYHAENIENIIAKTLNKLLSMKQKG